jgi:hypothetical protein
MPRIAKGAKWIFGWVLVGDDGMLKIPPEAWEWYHFQGGERAIFLKGSRTSGGFAISSSGLIEQMSPAFHVELRMLGYSRFQEDHSVQLPLEEVVLP